jgi:hypothetical protein
MPKEITIDKMVDQVFDSKANEIIDDIAEERTFIVNTLKLWVEDDEMWQQFAENKQMRKVFLMQMQALTLQELEANALIELVTIKQGIDE